MCSCSDQFFMRVFDRVTVCSATDLVATGAAGGGREYSAAGWQRAAAAQADPGPDDFSGDGEGVIQGEYYTWSDEGDEAGSAGAAEREWRAFTRQSKMDIVRDKWDISLLEVADPY